MRMFVFAVLLLFPVVACANDSGAEITPQGLVFKELNDISIEREDLEISIGKVEVNYVFLNHAKRDITTEVAFPIPEYSWQISQFDPRFSDFTVYVDGKIVSYSVEYRAEANGLDISELLKSKNIPLDPYENLQSPDYDSITDDFMKKIGGDKDAFVAAGIIGSGFVPIWRVRKTYHWRQTFPTGKQLQVRHVYKPVYGYYYFYPNLNNEFSNSFSCQIDEETNHAIMEYAGSKGSVGVHHVGYILQTANNWQRPIRHFSLKIHKNVSEHLFVCSDLNFEKNEAGHYLVKRDNYVPSSDLKINWLFKLN